VNLLAGCCQCGEFQTTVGEGSTVSMEAWVCIHGHGVLALNDLACLPCPRWTYKDGTDRLDCVGCPVNTDTMQVGTFDVQECV
jgi:hypothetical protein